MSPSVISKNQSIKKRKKKEAKDNVAADLLAKPNCKNTTAL